MPRFLLLAAPAFFLVLASAGFAADLGLGMTLEGGRPRVALWTLETLGVVGLYCLVRGDGARRPSLWDGVLVAWGAWIFRAPLLVLALAAERAHALADPWRVSAVLLATYTAGGLALASIDRRLHRRGAAPPPPPSLSILP